MESVFELIRQLMASPEALAGFFGMVVVPFVVELIKVLPKKEMKRVVAWLVSFGSSLGLGALAVYLKGDFVGGENLLTSVGAAFFAAQAMYELIWKPAKLDDVVNKKALKLFRRK